MRILSTSVEQVELPPEPTPAPPSAAQQAADELAALLPDEAAGYQLDKVAFTLEQVGSQVDPDVLAELQGIAEANGADVQSLSVARASAADADGFISLAGASIPGVPAEQVQDAMIRLLLPTDDSTAIQTQTIADREVTRIDLAPDPGPSDSAYVISSGDVVWFIVSTVEDVSDVVAALP